MLSVPQRYRQTDRQTDRRTTCDSNTALALRASRGKNALLLVSLVFISITIISQFLSCLSSFNLTYHVCFPTVSKDHILDLSIKPSGSSWLTPSLVTTQQTAHHFIISPFSLNCLSTALRCLLKRYIRSVVYISLTSRLLFLISFISSHNNLSAPSWLLIYATLLLPSVINTSAVITNLSNTKVKSIPGLPLTYQHYTDPLHDMLWNTKISHRLRALSSHDK